LANSGLGLDQRLKALLLGDRVQHVGRLRWKDGVLEVERGIEFWPLFGDTASQEGGGSRFVDASTTRLQVVLRGEAGNSDVLESWILSADGWRVPLRLASDGGLPVRLQGLRYRSFNPQVGLHPRIAARDPLVLELRSPAARQAFLLRIHDWHPAGSPYPGLPADLAAAAQRRAARFVWEPVAAERLPPLRDPPPAAVSKYCLDMRRLP
jgi:uncharacterized protein (DUF2126 family)